MVNTKPRLPPTLASNIFHESWESCTRFLISNFYWPALTPHFNKHIFYARWWFQMCFYFTPWKAGKDCDHGKLTLKQQNFEDQINLSDSMRLNLVIVGQDLFEKSFSGKMKQIRWIGLLTKNNQFIHIYLCCFWAWRCSMYLRISQNIYGKLMAGSWSHPIHP